MAMFTLLRRATAAALPLAAARRTTVSSSSRTFHTALSTHLLLHKEITPFVPYRHFSNAVAAKTADHNLVQILEAQINYALENDTIRARIPPNFPFDIVDNLGERTIQLKRQYENETITVEVGNPDVAPGENEDNDEPIFPLVVNVLKGSGVSMEFDVSVFPNKVSIDRLTITNPDESENEPVYRPEFDDLDENLQKAFGKYLKVRGITSRTSSFLHAYMICKDNQEYLMWLKNVKSFVEQ